jgi:choline dehydrogenase-like flavoprotein
VADRALGRRRPPVDIQTHLIAEQAPNPDSRVTLADECDRLGVPRARLDWRLSDADRHVVERTQQLLATELERAGVGTLAPESNGNGPWSGLTSSYHHMGTTRMARGPRDGVVDTNCRVHGVDNLYVAGSSVFPTGGVSNPSFTLVALSIRLADHLKERFGRVPRPA